MAELNHPLIVDFVPGGGQTQINNNKLTVPVFGYKKDTMGVPHNIVALAGTGNEHQITQYFII